MGRSFSASVHLSVFMLVLQPDLCELSLADWISNSIKNLIKEIKNQRNQNEIKEIDRVFCGNIPVCPLLTWLQVPVTLSFTFSISSFVFLFFAYQVAFY